MICEFCKKQFNSKEARTKFCSRQCYLDHLKKRKHELYRSKNPSIFQKENIYCDICTDQIAFCIKDTRAYCKICYFKKFNKDKKEATKSK